MRIGYITGEYPRATDTFVQREVEALRKEGAEVFTFSVRRTADEHIVGVEQEAERDRTFYILPPNIIGLLTAHLYLLITSPARYFRSIKLAWDTRQHGLKGNLYQLFYFLEAGILAKEIKTKKIQHLHNHAPDSSGTVSMLAAELGDFSFSFTLHGPYIFFAPQAWRLDEKAKRAKFIICISNFARSQGMLFAPVEKWQQMHIIHCGVDPELFELVSHNRVGNRLLYVGRLAATKGLPILLESIAKLRISHPDLILTVVGDGSDRKFLETMTKELDIEQNVKFVGYQSQTMVRQYMQQTDLFVLPSFAEGIPVVLMEALAAGVPVVTTQIAGISELVENGISGYLVPPGDMNSLTIKIEALLKDAELRQKFGVAGRAKVEQEFNIYSEGSRLYRIMSAAFKGEVVPVRLD
ncbi:MAG: glycosyltransferase family 4 protein [Xenococcaceae cyanobacterium MO_188.B19]|nr:glycosyltransferase family 4 protein [Xenococcaceae cyanobacterium MO_188.B19]